MDVEKQPRDSVQQTAPHHQKGVSSRELTKKRRKRNASLTSEDEAQREEQLTNERDDVVKRAEASFKALRKCLNKRYQRR